MPLSIPAGTQTGDTFIVRGKGMPSLRRGERGDQHVKVFVEVPKRLSAEQREALKKFADLLKGNSSAHPVRESFVEKAKKFFQL
ncbi:MAG: Chaperone protein DnaJ [Lentisphaerae bacterium ADurb.Bin242]|nr:MAG: Chaperone protein DnaJ [Lentisphaerae bacterium ADurb.Bin242]